MTKKEWAHYVLHATAGHQNGVNPRCPGCQSRLLKEAHDA